MELEALQTRFLCQDGVTDMFYKNYVPLETLTDQCVAQFPGTAPQPKAIVTKYGGVNVKWSSNIIYRLLFYNYVFNCRN